MGILDSRIETGTNWYHIIFTSSFGGIRRTEQNEPLAGLIDVTRLKWSNTHSRQCYKLIDILLILSIWIETKRKHTHNRTQTQKQLW